ncbi:similar to Saccharomyces cerevisiae YJR044C VPS55 Late endosomal protein involved in late endosome to vacuole trafficking [Maudiozyma saulgeensis]|uniref:Similar to Saccharomyces cerevisiae YJR044C VPS55 Late endosomal protein involved in late endosome to vacuole trafficking n=1 Tax=Maudiozyma saulgeensis TaxID=1789683 RepID=A0A1X7R1R5_9SACH|nr:similar to Saccharomyces cerevisiae YJR044C VPS55 Late endosomal protein involved in late endosome to vacuole trafficking [Kazachstania saulgeensis]
MEFKVSPLTKIISLSGFLALGFLLVILSCALFHNYYPLYDILIFLLAPIPNSLFSKASYSSSDFMSESSGSGSDLGHFLTGMLVTSGIALPLVFYHCNLIGSLSCTMSMMGGLIIYSSVVIFSWFFHSNWDNEEDTLFT